MAGARPAADRWPTETFLFTLTRTTVRGLLGVLFAFRVEGREHLPRGPAVVVANHPSALDPLFLGAAVPERLLFIAAREFLSLRAVGWAMRTYGCIPISRGQIDIAAIKESLRALTSGRKVVVFPEGGVSPTPRPPHRGAGLIAARGQVPIVPVGIYGTGQIFPLGAHVPRPGRVLMRFGPPIPPPRDEAGVQEAAVRQAMEWVRLGRGC